MANLDTAAKRRSSVSILMPFMPSGIIPGGVVQENRQSGAWSYSGILASSLVILSNVNPTISSLTLEREMTSVTTVKTIRQK